MKKINLFYLIFTLNCITTYSLLGTPNRNIIWTQNSCWIDSGLQCMTTLQGFNKALQQLPLEENSLGYKLRYMLNELKKTSSSSVNVSDFYQSSVAHGIGAHGTGGGDFVSSIIPYLLINDLPQLKIFFRIIKQNKLPEITVENQAVKDAQAQKDVIRNTHKLPSNLHFPKTEKEKQEKALFREKRNELIAPFDKIIKENTKKIAHYEYKVLYFTTISNIDQIRAKTDDKIKIIIAPQHLLLEFSKPWNTSDESLKIPLNLSPYFSDYSYNLQAKGLSNAGHATCVVHDGEKSWYFYNDLNESVKPVNKTEIMNFKFEGKKSDFLYYNRTNEYQINVDDPLALSYAARDGHRKAVENILKTITHAGINQKNEDLFSPLHWAVLSEQLEIVKMLVNSGADVNAKTISDETPLHFAALIGSTVIIDFLISKGASIDALNSSNTTPLHYAVKEFNLSATELLLDYGAHINTIPAYALHSLNEAITNITTQKKKVSLQLIELLLSFGADKKLLDNANKTSYDRCNTIGNALLKNEVKRLLDTITQTRHPSRQQPPQNQSELTSKLVSLKSGVQVLKKNLLKLGKQLQVLSQKLTPH